MAIALREIFARFGIQFDSAPLAKGAEKTNLLAKGLKDLEGKLAAPALVASLGLFVRGMYGMGLALGDSSRQLGMSATALREWQFVAEASGVPVEDMNNALGTLSANMRGAVSGNYDMLYQFRRLGVQVRDTYGRLRDTGDVMMEVGTRIAGIQRPITQARYLMMMFGESGRILLPVFQQGARAVNGMREEVRAITGGDLDRVAEQTRKMRAEMARLNLVSEALANSIFLEVLPAVRWMIVEAGKMARWLKTLQVETTAFESGLMLLSALAIAQFGRMGAELVRTFGMKGLMRMPMILALVAMVLLFDDIRGALNGDKSAIAEWIDAWQGAGTAARWVDDIKIGIEGVREAIFDAINGYRMLRGLPPLETAKEAREATDRMTQAQNEAGRRTDLNGNARSHATLSYSGDEPRRYTPTQYVAGQTYTTAPPVAPGGPRGGGNASPRIVALPGPPAPITVRTEIGAITVAPPIGTDASEVANQVVERVRAREQASLAAARRALVPVGAGGVNEE